MRSERGVGIFLKKLTVLLCVYLAFAGLLYWVGNEQMEAVEVKTDALTPSFSDGGLVGTHVIQQPFLSQADTLDQILLFVGTFGRVNQSEIVVQIFEGKELLWENNYSASQLKDLSFNEFSLDEPLTGVKGKELVLQIYTVDVPIDQAISFYFGNTISASKTEISVDIDKPAILDGQQLEGGLCMSVIGRNLLRVKQLYWPIVCVGAVLLSIVYLASYMQYVHQGKGLIAKIKGVRRYTFLMKQLVSRDFKTKYKRSVLGVLWSLLNPLLTMSVQYIIFASLFQSTIENFAVYLLTGIVIFNFFSEAVGMGLTSIVANASLITKVYVPKYIYPVSRVFSSAVNVIISMVPLCILIVFSGIPIKKSMVLIPLVLIYVTLFCIGVSLILSSAMVFFRDIQFLWGIISMLWMYITPIFYPESIIPSKFISIYHMNPLYQFIYFLREITMNGVAPSPYTFLFCTGASLISLVVGLAVFKKTQDRFVFYL